MGWEKNIIKRQRIPKRLERRLEENRGWVWKEARRLAAAAGAYGAEDDLAQEGFMGIVRADQLFRKRGCTFLTYARWWILNYMQDWLTRNARTVRTPESWRLRGQGFGYVVLDGKLEAVIPAVNGCPSHEFDDALVGESLNAALKKLSWKQQAILRGMFMEGKTEHEMSERLGISHQVCNMTKLRGLRQLRADRVLLEAMGMREPLKSLVKGVKI